MHALTAAVLPAYDEKATAALLYSETSLNVESNGKIKRLQRRAFRILRPEGAGRGKIAVFMNGQNRVTDLHGWCIPAMGKDYEVKKRDAIESALTDVENGMLASDVRGLFLQIPAAVPGSIVGYETVEEQTPYMLADAWSFQDTIPVREAHYRLQLPTGWTYKVTWVNHAEVAPVSLGPNQWQWTVEDIAALQLEPHMPFVGGVTGKMLVAMIPPEQQGQSIQSWGDIGAWYGNLARDRLAPSPELKAKVIELTASIPDLPAKMRALASFVQNDIRYVAIELGIGGYQPHPAADVLSHRYGDCKDKATLLAAMLDQIGVQSHYVIINATRGAVIAATPPNAMAFNHAILAVVLPAALDDPDLEATRSFPKLGKVLFFDPTDWLTPFGSLRGALQGNYGLLVEPGGGELVELPRLPVTSNGIARTAALTLDDEGTLRGDVREVRLGQRAAVQRWALRTAKSDTDQIKPVEALLAASMPNYQITKASVMNLRAPERPFEWRYSIEVDHYARPTGDLVLLRPRVLGSKAQKFLETQKPRAYEIEFDEPVRDTDVFEIALPAVYAVDELPPPVDVDAGFAAYHSKTEVVGHTLRYSRTSEISQVSVPADKAEELKSLYRRIEADERSAVVLKRVAR